MSAVGFRPGGDGGFSFDTGVLRGTLRAGGKSLGLTGVTHMPSGKRLDRSNGLLSHYRVFTRGVRYGGGAWDWPSTAQLRPDGSVEVVWPATPQRRFTLRAIYKWANASTLDLETTVSPETGLQGFETFVASYFESEFTNAAVHLESSADAPAGMRRMGADAGLWQMFPRTPEIVPLIQDGRWDLQPHPVEWKIGPVFQGGALAMRVAPASGIKALLLSPAEDCFAVSGPHETEGHYSLYLSLFGKDLPGAGHHSARVRLVVAGPSEAVDPIRARDDFLRSSPRRTSSGK